MILRLLPQMCVVADPKDWELTWQGGSQDAHDAVQASWGNAEPQRGQRHAQAQWRQRLMVTLGQLQSRIHLAPL